MFNHKHFLFHYKVNELNKAFGGWAIQWIDAEWRGVPSICVHCWMRGASNLAFVVFLLNISALWLVSKSACTTFVNTCPNGIVTCT